MSEAIGDGLNEKERVCLEHVRQAEALGLSFSEYCRQRGLKVNQWYWVRRGLRLKGVLAGPRDAEEVKPARFVPVRIAADVAGASACRIRHPSGWVMECASLPPAQWLSALMSGERA